MNLLKHIGSAARWVSLSYFLWSVGEGLWYYIRSLYFEKLGASPQEIGFAVGMLEIGRVLLIPVLIVMINRFNPRRIIVPGWGCGIIGAVIMALAPEWKIATIGLIIYSISGAVFVPMNIYLTLAYEYDPTRHPEANLHKIFSVSMAAASAGFIISPAIGGFVGEQWGLRSIFYFSLVWLILSLLAIWRTPVFPYKPEPTHYYYSLLRRSRFWLFNGFFLLIFITGTLGFALAPNFLESVHRYSTETIGILGALASLGGTLFGLYFAHSKPIRQLGIGLAFLTASYFLLLISGNWIAVYTAYFLFGIWFTLRSAASTLLTERFRPDQHGLAFIGLDFFYGAANFVGPLLAGTLYDYEPYSPFTVSLLVISAAFILMLFIFRPRNLAPIPAYSESTGEF